MSEYPNLDRAEQEAQALFKAALERAEAICPGNTFVETLRGRLRDRGHLTPGEVTALGNVKAPRNLHSTDMYYLRRSMERDGITIDRFGLDSAPPQDPGILGRLGHRGLNHLQELQRWGRAPGRVLENDIFASDYVDADFGNEEF